MQILRSALTYTGLNVLQRGVGFLLLPVYTAYLTPSDYGILGTISALAGFLALLYPLGCDSALMRQYFPSGGQSSQAKEVWGSLLGLLFVTTLGMSALLLLGRRWLLIPIMGEVPFWPFIALGLVIAACDPPRTYYGLSLQIRQRAFDYAKFEGSFIMVRLIALLGALVFFDGKAAGALTAFAGAGAIFAFLGLAFFHQDVRWGFDRKLLKASLRYSLPIVPHNLAGWSTAYLGTLVLNGFKGTAEVGLYTLAANLALIQTFLVSGFTSAYLPRVYKGLSDGGAAAIAQLRRQALLAAGAFGVCAVGIGLFSAEVLRLMARPSFWGAAHLVPLLVLAGFMQGIYTFYAHLLYYHKGGTRWLPMASGAGAVMAVLLMLVLIPRWSMVGAASAVLAGVMTRLVAAAFICNWKFPRLWPQKTLAFLSLVTVCGCLVPWAFHGNAQAWTMFTQKTCFGLAYLFLALLGIHREVSLKALLADLRKGFGKTS